MDEIVIVAIFSFTFVFSRSVHGSEISHCSQTPYPEICRSFIGTKFQTSQYNSPSAFRESSLRVTMAHAQQAHGHVSSMDLKSFDERAKSAWSDCLELYEDAIKHLNRSIISQSSPVDVQTWLSAAFANHQTCLNGFKEFKLTSHLKKLPFRSNFSRLLSNSLAINKATLPSSVSPLPSVPPESGFPGWVSAGDRRLLQSPAEASHARLVVAKDGSGNYFTISEAVAAVVNHRFGSERFVIYVKSGVYRENVVIKKSLKNLMLIGDGIDATIVTSNKNFHSGYTTYSSATFAVAGIGFIAMGITFENTAGPEGGQAVALRSSSDFSVFYSCSFKGYQDTLYIHSLRQFYRDCHIYGTVDFIFGDAVAVLQNCNIFIRKPSNSHVNAITAHGRNDPSENTGFVIHDSRVTAAPDLQPYQNSFRTYLGRPWKRYSRTVFMKSYLDGLIDPEGWLPWAGNYGLRTLYYAEYENKGSGANTDGRVNWQGYHVLTSEEEASKFTVENFIAGNLWIPATGVPFNSGL